MLHSPSGVYLAVGLKSGDVEILDGEIGSTLFILRESKVRNSVLYCVTSSIGCGQIKTTAGCALLNHRDPGGTSLAPTP